MLKSHMSEVRQKLRDAQDRHRPVFIAAPLIRWQAELFQRPQHIARALADLGVLVLFFEPKSPHLPQQITRIGDSLYILPEPAFRGIIEDYSGFWVDIYSTSAMPQGAITWLRGNGHRIIYEYVDEIDPTISTQAEKCQALFDHFAESPPEITIVTAAKLRRDVDAAWPENTQVILSPNAADPAHFEDAWRFSQATPLTISLRERAAGRPIIGYYGALADWIDYDIIREIAAKSPDLFFCYIGPKYRPSIKLPSSANIAWPGPVEYNILPAIASIFNLAIIPFRSGDVAKATSPLKLYEYFALRLPVVVNKDMSECLQFEYVAGAESSDEWCHHIRQSLRLRHSESYEFFCKTTVLQNTWALRAAQMLQVMTRGTSTAAAEQMASLEHFHTLLSLPTADVAVPRKLVMPSDTLETAEMALAEALTGNMAAMLSAKQIGAGDPLWNRSVNEAASLRESRDKLLSERRASFWKLRRAINWPAVRPVVPDFTSTQIKIALIADEFTSALLSYDADVTNLTPDNGIKIADRQNFDILIMESVWFGQMKTWSTLWKNTKDGGGLFPILEKIIITFRNKGIPTIFWNKEDPEHYEIFLPIARLFDYIYTTEAACLDKYRADLGHNRVGTLAFAAQPRLQTPFLQTDHPRSGVAFAGSWYHGKHAYRAEQQAALLTAGLEFGVDIYDRALRDRTGQFVYPAEFRTNVVGTLDFHRVCTAYRQYEIFLNVNTVSESDTMCARRVFEIAASRTAIVTTPSRAVARFFGDAIPNGEGVEFFRGAIGTYLEDPLLRMRDAHRIYRETHRHHTYRQRLAQILGDTGKEPDDSAQERVVVLVDTASTADGGLSFVQNMVLHQTLRPVLVALAGVAAPAIEALESAGIACLAHTDLALAIAAVAKAAEPLKLRAGRDGVALMHATSSYGAEYLADQMLALRLGAAPMVAKSRGNTSCEFQTVDLGLADPRALLLDAGFFLSIYGNGEAVRSIDLILFEIFHRTGKRTLLLSDRFNFSRSELTGNDPP